VEIFTGSAKTASSFVPFAPFCGQATEDCRCGGAQSQSSVVSHNISLIELRAAPSATVGHISEDCPIPTLPIRRFCANQNLLVVFVENPHPSEPLPAKPTRPNCASVDEARVVATDIRNYIEQAPRLAYPKSLNASTDCAALA
jgi:hypothetical protein